MDGKGNIKISHINSSTNTSFVTTLEDVNVCIIDSEVSVESDSQDIISWLFEYFTLEHLNSENLFKLKANTNLWFVFHINLATAIGQNLEFEVLCTPPKDFIFEVLFQNEYGLEKNFLEMQIIDLIDSVKYVRSF